MKKAIYKILTPAYLAMMMGMLLTSCSNKMESLTGSTKKLMYAQSVDKPKTETNKTAEVAVDPLTNSCPLESPAPLTQTETISGQADPKTKTANSPFKFTKPGIHKKVSLTKTIHKQIAFLKKQVSAVQDQVTKTPAASYKGTDHTHSLLGAAILFLILGVVLVFLGFDILGSLFWVIGVVLFVAAIIFFILWLVASAV